MVVHVLPTYAFDFPSLCTCVLQLLVELNDVVM
jgi:hypothetical protein